LRDYHNLLINTKRSFLKIDPDVNFGLGYPSTTHEGLNETGMEVIADLKELSWEIPLQNKYSFATPS